MDGVPADAPREAYVVGQRIAVEKRPLRFHEKARRLTDFPEYRFFTPAIAYMWGGFTDAVLEDFRNLHGPVDIGFHRFRHASFSGLHTGRSNDWNHALWAVPTEHWQPFVDHIVSAMSVDEGLARVHRYAYQEFPLIDPLYVERSAVVSQLPLVTVGAFAALTNHYQAAFDYEKPPPTLRFYDPDHQSRLYADAVFQGLDLDEVVNREQRARAQDRLKKELSREGETGIPAGDRGGGGEAGQ